MIYPRSDQDHAAVADHYDELDAIYRSLWGEHVHHGYWRTGRESQTEAVAKLSDLVSEKLGFSAGDTLVDIGCGYGGTARRFASAGAQIKGFSLSAQQIAHAPPAPRVELHCRDWLNNGLEDGSMSGAYAIESSEHMSDKPAFFREARRVLHPSGRLVICAWLAREQPTDWQVRHLLEPICYEGRLPSMGSETDYRKMASAAGFDCVDFADISVNVRHTWTLCLLRLAQGVLTSPEIRRRVLNARNRLFALSVPRLILAYRTGAMRYGVFTFVAADAAARTTS